MSSHPHRLRLGSASLLVLAATASGALAAPAAAAPGPLTLTSRVTLPADTSPDSGDRVATLGDFDGDGRGDHAIASPGAVDVYLARTTLRVTVPQTIGSSTHVNVGTAGDFDDDGLADLLITPGASGGQAWILYGARTNPASLALASAGSRVTTITFGAWGVTTVRMAGIGDFDGDGKDDLVVPAKLGANSLNGTSAAALIAGGPRLATIRSAEAGGRISHFTGYRACSTYFTVNFPYVKTSCRVPEPDFAAAGDFNGDGRADLYLDPREGGSPTIVFGRAGQFTVPATAPGAGLDLGTRVGGQRSKTPMGYLRVLRPLGDVDGDGLSDLLVPTGTPQSTTYREAAVLRGRRTSGGTLSASEPFITIPTPAGKALVALGAAGDQTGDGRGDLLVNVSTSSRSDVVVATLAPGASSFTVPTTPVPGAFPSPLDTWQVARPADLDGDGAPDLLLADPAGVLRLTHPGGGTPPPPATAYLEARQQVVGPTGLVLGRESGQTGSAKCGAAPVKTVPLDANGIAAFGADGSLAAGTTCIVNIATPTLPTTEPYDRCTWSTKITFRGQTISAGATITLSATERNFWEKTVTCSVPTLPGSALPADFGGWNSYPPFRATDDGSTVVLSTGPNQTTGIVTPNPVNLEGKTLSFLVSMNGGNGGAEGVGLAFLAAKPATNAGNWLGGGGPLLGLGGLGGLALALDPYQQPGEPGANTVSWVEGESGGLPRRLASASANVRLRATAPIAVSVTVKDGKLTANVGGGRAVLSIDRRLAGPVYLAFTGSTSSVWQRQAISSVTLTGA